MKLIDRLEEYIMFVLTCVEEKKKKPLGKIKHNLPFLFYFENPY